MTEKKTKNQMLRRAAWLGTKVDWCNFLAAFSDVIGEWATKKSNKLTTERDDLVKQLNAVDNMSNTKTEKEFND